MPKAKLCKAACLSRLGAAWSGLGLCWMSCTQIAGLSGYPNLLRERAARCSYQAMWVTCHFAAGSEILNISRID